ncbi:chitinase 18-11 [Metarhizium album ARSEF 1941]|uniref:chitinase n=1 Tax=Metarhizium album (strain ARSEF 1941) TaxID=1081103 RepID=A0A0B2X4M2_METAS|nr:chitinase 18-11 [Metarhizium album ARSEF 1941]KHO00703.1 chitinase 18-11 [Metarhizium album ARSEF 1941]
MRSCTFVLAAAATAVSAAPRYVMYFDQYVPSRKTVFSSLQEALLTHRFTLRWHKATLPPRDVTAGVNYVITAFAPSSTFTFGSYYEPFMPLSQVRDLFDRGTKVCMAIGGWGDTSGFSAGAATPDTRKTYAKNVAAALSNLGYDCVDVDWEYPAGNGQDYKQIPNDQKVSEIETYPLLLEEIKAAIGDKELSIAVPGKEGDMIAFTAKQVPRIDKAVDFINVMTYDIMNRRDNATNHHTSVVDSAHTIDTYIQRGMTPSKMNLGFAFYAKYFTTKDGAECANPTGCPTAVLEAADGSDTGLSGAVTFEVENYNNAAFVKALTNGQTDTAKGGQWYWDSSAKQYWTWDTPDLVSRKFKEIVATKKLGGVFAWSLAQDSHDWSHFKAMQAGVKAL